jgi:hypothetical protein
MSIYAPNGYFGDHRVMPQKLSWKHDEPCDFHSPDIGTHADLCGRCGWQRSEHAQCTCLSISRDPYCPLHGDHNKVKDL